MPARGPIFLAHLGVHPGSLGAALLVALAVGGAIGVARALRTGSEDLARRVVVVALVFQVFHFLEHVLQIGAWALWPENPPWMSLWAGSLVRELGWAATWIPGGGAGSQRGTEVLHLLGNVVFLSGAVGLWWLASRRQIARRWAATALAAQGVHVGEHILLTATLLVWGRPMGFSTGFSTLSGTQPTAHRVVWHFVANMVPTVASVVAASRLWKTLRQPETAERSTFALRWSAPATARVLSVSMVLVLVSLVAIPQVAARTVGEPLPPPPGPDADRPHEPSPDLMTFRDVAREVGLNFRHSAFRWDVSGDAVAMMGGGLCWIDYDRDGWLDLFVVNSWAENERGLWLREEGLPRSALFRNSGGHFTDVTDEAGAGLELRGNGCVAADLDGDGWTDLYVTSEWNNALLWNQGDGTFVEGARAAGVDAYGWHTAAAVGDLNQDGWQDLVVLGYADRNAPIPDATRGFPNTLQPVRDLVFLSEGPDDSGRVTFREVGEAAGVEVEAAEYGLGLALRDFDGDGRLDLYVANDTNPNRLYMNEPFEGGAQADPMGLGFRLVEQAADAGADDDGSGMGVAAGDYDGDGLDDLFVTNMAGQLHAFHHNRGIGDGGITFDDAFGALGLSGSGTGFTGWGAAWADLTLDTHLDLVVANGGIPVMDVVANKQPLQIFASQAAAGSPGQLRSVGPKMGLGLLERRNARGMALADFDNDGDLDIAINSIAGPVALLRNTGAGGHWLMVDLGAPETGTIVRVTLPDGTKLSRQVSLGTSYLSSEDPRVHFGLGTHQQVPEVRVEFPDGTTSVLADVPADQVVAVER